MTHRGELRGRDERLGLRPRRPGARGDVAFGLAEEGAGDGCDGGACCAACHAAICCLAYYCRPPRPQLQVEHRKYNPNTLPPAAQVVLEGIIDKGKAKAGDKPSPVRATELLGHLKGEGSSSRESRDLQCTAAPCLPTCELALQRGV